VLWAKWAIGGLSGSRVLAFATWRGLLVHALELAPPGGLHLEFGVYRGETINFLSSLNGNAWFGFDSFDGLPSGWTGRLPKGAFTTRGELPPVRPNVTLIKGWFADSLPRFSREHQGTHASFVHIDCDLYTSTKVVLSELTCSIMPGTVIVFDEYVTVRPDDEARALREWLKRTRYRLEYIGCSADGSVAIRILPKP
jgi:hypothetical protein